MLVQPLDTIKGSFCLPFPRIFKFGRKGRRSTELPIAKSVAREKQPLEESPQAFDNSDRCKLFYGSCCAFSTDTSQPYTSDDAPPSYGTQESDGLSDEVVQTIQQSISDLDKTLRSISLKIHDHPELGFQEKYAHALLTDFMESHGFTVTRHYLHLDTAWRAEFTHGKGGRTMGINAEMDALPELGHACGHNLIAMGGVGTALALKAAMQAHDVPGKIVLLGTPAEEGGAGKVILLDRGAYKGMDACIMCHPATGPPHSMAIHRMLAMQIIDVEYFGQSAHAGAAPWQGVNALDAAFLAYSSISVLRQQIKPDSRVHGVIQGADWSPNVIPDYAKMRWYVRAPTKNDLLDLSERVRSCFSAGALATGCRVKLSMGRPYFEVRHNSLLAEEFSRSMQNRCGLPTLWSNTGASTDFGNVSYELPALHPSFPITTDTHGGNHTPAFTRYARTPEAHQVCLQIIQGLAFTGFRVLQDEIFSKQVKEAFHKA
ncbi:amidohydrolase [Coniophora puteana RWD-64-598 SS2]|uniref:Amidohydrolase n=1 Tax=Coniophora puteana (strain RWD-64-598) TaxID=741705 RepID=A0A5M3MJB6_CONPW|nr:amidohydrolase [Coniophora puteana RWD-64-598 SS2]EIW79338.1 amidohydrolase [Coniophora puteana RWD-64-598 SS2]